MMKALVAAGLLFGLAASGASAADVPLPARLSASGKPALPDAPPPPALPDAPLICPPDVRRCTNGSDVSRNAALDCAFNPCPDATQH